MGLAPQGSRGRTRPPRAADSGEGPVCTGRHDLHVAPALTPRGVLALCFLFPPVKGSAYFLSACSAHQAPTCNISANTPFLRGQKDTLDGFATSSSFCLWPSPEGCALTLPEPQCWPPSPLGPSEGSCRQWSTGRVGGCWSPRAGGPLVLGLQNGRA